jgi:hypothetical protein
LDDQRRGLIEAAVTEEAGSEFLRTMLGQDRVDARLAGGIGRAAERERYRSEAELEQAVAACGL